MAAASLALAACGSKGNGGAPPTGPTPPAPAPQIACPRDVSVREVLGSAQTVTFDAPQVTGGAAPVTVTCTPASGASFPLGTTAVACAASDAQTRQATCSFSVTLTGFSIAAARFDAFGDSITEGEVGRPSLALPFLDPPNAYPTRLQAALDETYPGQGLVVINRGLSGDSVEDTEAKVRQFLPVDRPDAALLLSGYNDLLNGCPADRPSTPPCGDAINKVADGMRACLRRVKEANAGVRYTFLSSLTPPGPSGSHRIDGNAILQVNGRLRQVAAAEGAVFVDSYAPFVGHEAEYVNVDGLHLRPAGYQALADVFFAAIQAVVPRTPLPATFR
jgi:lysophospholipase L1-like esterase